MSDYPITLSIPGAGMIVVISKQYETLSDEFLQAWFYQLMRDHRAVPDYLFASAEDHRALQRIIREDIQMSRWLMYDSDSLSADRYPNKVTGKSPAMVVFPGLPERTLLLGNLLEMRSEVKSLQGISQVTTRTYAKQQE